MDSDRSAASRVAGQPISDSYAGLPFTAMSRALFPEFKFIPLGFDRFGSVLARAESGLRPQHPQATGEAPQLA